MKPSLLVSIPLAFAASVTAASVLDKRLSNSDNRRRYSNDDGGYDLASVGINTAETAQNPQCQPWYPVRDAIMSELFQGQCNDLARAAVRLSFHDAASFSLALQSAGKPNGAADGSFLTDPDEVNRPENNGLQNVVASLTPFVSRFNVSPGDLLHLAGTLGVISCPGGPPVRTYIGRTPPKNPTPPGLVPDHTSPVSTLVERVKDMSFTVQEMMALIGAHTAAKQRHVNESLTGESFDSTVDVWDVRFYSQTRKHKPQKGVFHLDSDVAFATDPSTSRAFAKYVGKQGLWDADYSTAHEKMSLLGYDKFTLTDCTELLPNSIDLSDVSGGSFGSGNGLTYDYGSDSNSGSDSGSYSGSSAYHHSHHHNHHSGGKGETYSYPPPYTYNTHPVGHHTHEHGKSAFSAYDGVASVDRAVLDVMLRVFRGPWYVGF